MYLILRGGVFSYGFLSAGHAWAFKSCDKFDVSGDQLISTYIKIMFRGHMFLQRGNNGNSVTSLQRGNNGNSGHAWACKSCGKFDISDDQFLSRGAITDQKGSSG